MYQTRASKAVKRKSKMKITKSQLKQIIKEELESALNEEGLSDRGESKRLKGVVKSDEKDTQRDQPSQVDMEARKKVGREKSEG